MGFLTAVKNFFAPGSKEKEELVATIREWDELLKACTTRIESLEKGYEFLRYNMVLRREYEFMRNSMVVKKELVTWKRLALVSVVISLVALVGVIYLIFKR